MVKPNKKGIFDNTLIINWFKSKNRWSLELWRWPFSPMRPVLFSRSWIKENRKSEDLKVARSWNCYNAKINPMWFSLTVTGRMNLIWRPIGNPIFLEKHGHSPNPDFQKNHKHGPMNCWMPYKHTDQGKKKLSMWIESFLFL